jgi:catalase
MTIAKPQLDTELAEEVLQTIDALNHGKHTGYRPVHAKGILLTGRFTPSPDAASLTRAPHVQRSSTPVTVRFSNTTGLPAIADTDPNASPRGMAIRFHLAEHVHSDIIAHSVNGFPARNVDEFLELLRAIIATGPDSPHPTPIEAFLGAHPAALAFVQTPKPVPTSFFKESFYAVNAHRFTNAEGVCRYGRYRILPEGGNEYLDAAAAAKQAPDFLFDDLRDKLARGPVAMRIAVQMAAAEDIVNDATVQWPDNRPMVEFGTMELMSVLQNNEAEQRHIIFDPIPRVDGIDPSGDPLLEPRASVYLMSGRRRRAAK